MCGVTSTGVSAGRCHVDVAILAVASGERRAGPRRFEVQAAEKVCSR